MTEEHGIWAKVRVFFSQLWRKARTRGVAVAAKEVEKEVKKQSKKNSKAIAEAKKKLRAPAPKKPAVNTKTPVAKKKS